MVAPSVRPVVLTDFDGVLTEVAAQAAAVDAARGAELARRSGWEAPALAAVLADVEAALDRAPALYGWLSHGRITAFADEDPFLRHNGCLSALGALAGGGHPGARALVAALATGGAGDLGALADATFLAGSRSFLLGHGHALRPGAAAALGRLLEVADVVVCTNFATDAVAATLAAAGCPPAPPRLRLIGEARKGELGGPTGATTRLGGRDVAIDRPRYAAVLAAVRPDVVVGDVVSLDLALPLALTGPGAPACRLVLAPHTPAWARALVVDGGGGRLAPLADLAELIPALGAGAGRR